MNSKKILFAMIILFCVDIVSAMDQAIIKQTVTFKSLEGVPCWSLNRFNKKLDDLSEEKREKIRQQLHDSGEKKFLALFNVVTVLPSDLQRRIVVDICNNNQEAIQSFFKDPMIDVLNDRSLAHQVLEDETFCVFRGWSDTNNPNWNQDTIFVYSKDILTFEANRKRDPAQYYSREELKPIANAINTVCDKFLKEKEGKHVKEWSITYAYRDCYTLRNFWKHQDKWQWALLPVFLFPFGVKQLAQYCYPDLSLEEMEKMSRAYAAQEEVNAFVRDKFETRKDDAYLSLLSTKFSQVDELMKNNPGNRENVYAWCYFAPAVLGGFVGAVASGGGTSHMMRKEEDKEWDKYSRLYRFYRYFVPVCAGIFTYFSVSFGSLILGQYISDAIERPVFGMACVTGCYAAVVSLWNVTKMRSIQEKRIKISEISQLLKRTDIEIIQT